MFGCNWSQLILQVLPSLQVRWHWGSNLPFDRAPTFYNFLNQFTHTFLAKLVVNFSYTLDHTHFHLIFSKNTFKYFCNSLETLKKGNCWELILDRNQPCLINVTSFSRISYCSNGDYWILTPTQNRTIHFTILDVHVLKAERLSTQLTEDRLRHPVQFESVT